MEMGSDSLYWLPPTCETRQQYDLLESGGLAGVGSNPHFYKVRGRYEHHKQQGRTS